MSLRSSQPFLTLLVVLALGLAACGGGSDSEDATEAPDESTTEAAAEPSATEAAATPAEDSPTPGEPGSAPATEDAGDADANREAVVQEFVAAGLTEEDANCVIDVYAAEGVSMDDVAAVGSGQVPTDPEAFATASANLAQCLSEEQLGAFANTAAEQDPEAVRAAFIQGFITTGATEEQAGCIFDELTEAGFTLSDLSSAGSSPSVELEEAATQAGETCGLG